MKKRFLSLILCLLIIVPSFVMPISAAYAPTNAFHLDDLGVVQDHYYLGGVDTTAPVQDGAIGASEYTVSKSVTFENQEAIGISNGVHCFSYDGDYLYMAVSFVDVGFNDDCSCANCKTHDCEIHNSFSFSFNFNSAGGASDICSRVSVDVNYARTYDNNSYATVGYLDQHTVGNVSGLSNKTHYPLNMSEVISAYKASYATASNTVTYEIKLSLDGLKKNFGLIIGDEMMFYSSVSNARRHALNNDATEANDVSSNMYRCLFSSDVMAAINKAVPAHKMGLANWAGHVVHFCSEAEADAVSNANIHTLKGASARIYSVEDSGLRFATAFKKSYIDANRANITEIGTIIAIADYIDSVDSFKSLTPANEGVTYVKVKADLTKPYKYEPDSYVYAGSVVKIKDTATEYAGIGYVVIGGQTYYSDSYSVRSVAGVAVAALRDLSATNLAGYRCKTTLPAGIGGLASVSTKSGYKDVYSPYTATERALLYNFAAGYNQNCVSNLMPRYDLESKAVGNIRVVSSNVYFHEMNWVYKSKATDAASASAEVTAAIQRKADAIASTGADVVLLQEVSSGNRKSGGEDYNMHDHLDPKLAAKGYTQINPYDTTRPNADSSKYIEMNTNFVPIWYNADTLDLISSGHEYYDTFANSKSGAGDLTDAYGFTWAVFEDKDTEKQFIAISTHFSYHGDGDTGNKLRVSDATQLVSYINNSLASKGLPIIIGGDFNNSYTADPYNLIVSNVSANLCNAMEIAGIVKNGAYGTSHTYPSSSADMSKYLPGFGSPIDHIFVTGSSKINVKEYQTIVSDAFTQATDHVPVSIDFALN